MTVLLHAENDLVRLLLVELDKVIAKMEFEIESNLKNEDPFNFKKKLSAFGKET